jgi:hypothetical protein
MGVTRIPGWLIAASLIVPVLAWAQAASPAPRAGASAPRAAKPAAAKSSTRPLWRELSAGQQQALAPLAAQWDTLNEAQKRKWIALSSNFPKLSGEEQAKLHSRMTEWVTLSPQQRTIARLNYGAARKLTPDEKKAKWEAYQALPPEEKKKLAAKAAKPPATAAALKPAPAEKMAVVPRARHTPHNNKSPRIAAAPHPADGSPPVPTRQPVQPAQPSLAPQPPQQQPPLPPQAGTPD